jgi:DNA-directed RNA polymerase subunit alpha
MATTYLGRFELPQKPLKVEASDDGAYAKFVIEPFENGFGHTIGNALRRVLLNAIEGAAIFALKIEGVQHEFQSLEGIVEDVTDIVLNLKKVRLTATTRDPVKLYIDVDREGLVKAADIQGSHHIRVLNPEQVICTVDRKRRFYAELEVRVGRGYCLSEDNKRSDQAIGEIPIDSLFSPVTLVRYAVENTRVGQMTDFDRLIIEINTDGRISPDDALKHAVSILKHHLSVFDQVSDCQIEFETATREASSEDNRLRKLLNMSVNEMELSVRSANCLNNANILTVGQLASMTEADMLKFRNFGKKSLEEIKNCLLALGLSLGMSFDSHFIDIPKPDISPELLVQGDEADYLQEAQTEA